jgi:uncharacterized alpha-E superfamily protein
MLSRDAETIYWIGRYQERAENTARLITVNTNLLLDLPHQVAPGWDALISLLGCDAAYSERHPEFTERRVANFLISDESNPSSIISALSALRENARTTHCKNQFSARHCRCGVIDIPFNRWRHVAVTEPCSDMRNRPRQDRCDNDKK